MSGAQGSACRFLVGLTLDMHALRKGENDSVCNPAAEWYGFYLTQPPIFRNLRGLKYKIENVHPSCQMFDAKRQQFVCGRDHISSSFCMC